MAIDDNKEPVSAETAELLEPDQYENYQKSLKKVKEIVSRDVPFSLLSEDTETIAERLLGTLGHMIRAKKLINQKLEK